MIFTIINCGHFLSLKFIHLWADTFQLFQYSIIKLLRLGKDYDTNCRYYGQHYKYDTRSDCFTSCVQNHHNIVCNDSKLSLMSTLVREEFISKNRNKTFTNCSAYTQTSQDKMISCWKHCKPNCQYKHYPANAVKIRGFNNSQAQVIVEHNAMPDVLVEYIPETSFI